MSEPAKQTAGATIFGAMPAVVDEKWFFIDGQWWHSVE
jgi:hypothetical protein